MSVKRKIIRIHRPDAEPGFLGAGHMARPVISGGFAQTDPFIMLMDDVLDKKDDVPVGGPHPHAGFETVSLMLEGEMGDDAHKMKAGDFQMMTAGSGIIHTETIEKKSRMRLLQLWLNLPKSQRWTTPRVQDMSLTHVPQLNANGVQLKLYSGELSGLKSPVQNYTPVIIADIIIDAGVSTVQQIPANFNAFLYVIKGVVKAGEDEMQLNPTQAGWLDLYDHNSLSELKLTAGEEGARLVLYAGKPTGDLIVSYGPFIADSSEDIQRLFHEYKQGKMKHISTVPESQRMVVGFEEQKNRRTDEQMNRGTEEQRKWK